MGIYISITDVEGHLPARAPFTGSTRPNATSVLQAIDEVEGDIDSILVISGYPLPIPAGATGALRQIRTAAVRGAAAMVERIAPTSQDREPSMRLWTEAKKMLRDGQLPDYPKTGADVQPRQGPDAADSVSVVRIDMAL